MPWCTNQTDISIHVPAWGTTGIMVIIRVMALFQSTCPRGARRYNGDYSCYGIISIHVPAWGTTLIYDIIRRRIEFQSTCPRGARQSMMIIRLIRLLFQSTCPRGARRTNLWMQKCVKISIHVPAWGTTSASRRGDLRAVISIHVPAWGTTIYLFCEILPVKFQSTCPRGARQKARSAQQSLEISIHVPAWGTTSSNCFVCLS